MRHKSNQIVIILIVVLLLTGVGVGLYFLIEHLRKQHDTPVKPVKPDKPDKPDKPKAIRAVDKCDKACSDPTFAGKTIVHQVNCVKSDGTECDDTYCPKKPTLDKCTCPPPPQPKPTTDCKWKPGEWIPQ